MHVSLSVLILAAAVSAGAGGEEAEGEEARDDAPTLQIDRAAEPGVLLPFGAPHPDRPEAAKAFDFLIGQNDCVQTRYAYPDGAETRSRASWVGYYDHGGWSVRDTFASEGGVSLNIRIYDPATQRWRVWYFLADNRYYAGEWTGGSDGDRMVLEKDDELGGRPVISRLEYSDITPDGFTWISRNVDRESGEEFVDWRITCAKARYAAP